MITAEKTYGWLTISIIFIIIFFTNVEFSGVTLTLPSIAKALGMHLDLLTWVMNVYTIIMAIIVIPGGHIGDRYGRKMIFLIGCILFVVGSFLVGIANASWFLLLGRIIQGLGGGTLFPAALALSYMQFPSEERPKVISIVAAGSFLGLAAGPLIAGLLVHYIDWRWVFYINVPVGIITIILSYLYIAEVKHVEHGFRFDYVGLLLLIIMVGSLITALNYGQRWGWGSSTIIILLAVAIVSTILLIIFDYYHRSPLLLLNLFFLNHYTIGLMGRMIVNLALISISFTSVLYLRNILGHTAEVVGYIFLFLMIPVSLVAFIISRVLGKFSLKTLSIVGSILLLVGLILLSSLTLQSPLWLLMIYFIVVGISFGITFPSYTALALKVLPSQKAAAGTGMFYLGILIASSLGVVIAAAILQSIGNAALIHQLTVHKLQLTTTQYQNLLGIFSGKETNVSGFPTPVLKSVYQAFMSGYSWTMLVNAIIVVIGIILNALFLKSNNQLSKN